MGLWVRGWASISVAVVGIATQRHTGQLVLGPKNWLLPQGQLRSFLGLSPLAWVNRYQICSQLHFSLPRKLVCLLLAPWAPMQTWRHVRRKPRNSLSCSASRSQQAARSSAGIQKHRPSLCLTLCAARRPPQWEGPGQQLGARSERGS